MVRTERSSGRRAILHERCLKVAFMNIANPSSLIFDETNGNTQKTFIETVHFNVYHFGKKIVNSYYKVEKTDLDSNF